MGFVSSSEIVQKCLKMSVIYFAHFIFFANLVGIIYLDISLNLPLCLFLWCWRRNYWGRCFIMYWQLVQGSRLWEKSTATSPRFVTFVGREVFAWCVLISFHKFYCGFIRLPGLMGFLRPQQGVHFSLFTRMLFLILQSELGS